MDNSKFMNENANTYNLGHYDSIETFYSYSKYSIRVTSNHCRFLFENYSEDEKNKLLELFAKVLDSSFVLKFFGCSSDIKIRNPILICVNVRDTSEEILKRYGKYFNKETS